MLTMAMLARMALSVVAVTMYVALAEVAGSENLRSMLIDFADVLAAELSCAFVRRGSLDMFSSRFQEKVI